MKFKLSHLIITVLMVLLPLALPAQNRIVSGTVTDQGGEPLVGAGVLVQGSATRGTVTDVDGRFQISAAPAENLVVSFIGYEDVVVSAAQTTLSIVLRSDNNFLEETVVVGYGVQKKATLTGAVSAVTNKDIIVTKNENVVNMLSGKVAGLRISQRSSQPGAFDNAIDIRGMGTPLFVVDGIPRDQGYFSRMDSNEIESVSVLKDASAAIYGVRAANGVILVTTKHGTSGSDGAKFDIDLSANYGWQNFLYVPQTASAATHMMLINEKNLYGNLNGNYWLRATPKYTWGQIMDYSSGLKESTYWTDELFRNNVPQSQYNLSVNGASDKISYFFNLGYMDQEGSYKSGSLNYHRWNFRSNVDAKITDRLRTTLSLSGYTDETNQPMTTIWAVYKKGWTYTPSSHPWIFTEDGQKLPNYDTEFLENENPVVSTDSAYSGYRQSKRYNFNGSLAVTYDIPYIEGLNARAFYSYDYYTTDNTNYTRTYYLYTQQTGALTSLVQQSPGQVYRSADPNMGTVLQLSLNYAHKFGKHNVSAMALYEETYNKWDNFYAQRNMLLDNEYLFAGEEEDQKGSSGGLGDISRRALIGHLNYDYAGKYLLDFAVRRDASSRFPEASRWGTFPSVSVGWRISEEPFIKNHVKWITNLKLRASYGRMGDDGAAGTYPSIYTGFNLANNVQWFYNSSLLSGVTPSAIPNPNLTWYTADTYNAGLDFNFWNELLGGTFEVFKRQRSGLLATSSVVLPGTVGASMPQENIESDMTYGWEFQLTHRNHINDFRYYVTGQMSATKNRWVYHLDSTAGNSMENWRRGAVSGRNKDIWSTIVEAGRFTSYEEIQNYAYTGANYGQGTLPGDYYYEDWNGDGFINGEDNHPVATYNLPVFNYGVTIGGDWRGFDFAVNFQGAAGVNSQYGEVFTEVGPFNGGAVLTMYSDRWHMTDVNADPWNPHTQWIEGYYPATGHSFNTGTTGIKDVSYCRLKTAELGYTLPGKWTRKVNIKSLRLYVSGYNLLTFSGLKYIDPERPGVSGGASNSSVAIYNYPVNRTINVGANLKF